MADNITVRDSTGNAVVVRSTDTGGIQVPIHRLDSIMITGTAGLSAANQDLLTNTANGWYDAAAFFSGSIQIIGSAGISSGAVIFEQTNDNSSTTGIALEVHELGVINANPLVAAATIAASTRRAFAFNISCRYIRARISTVFAGGTVQAIAELSQQPFAAPVMNMQQTTAASLLTTALPSSALTGFTLQSAATTNATSIKAAVGSLTALSITNVSASTRYVKLYNKASAPTVGTDVPVMTIPIPTNSFLTFEFGPTGMKFSTGIALAITGAIGDADTTAVAANDVKIMMTYN